MVAVAHLDDSELAEFFGGAADDALRARVFEEIARCDACRRLVAALAGEAAGASEDPLARYAIGERLGRGAWGAVYRARDRTLKREVAIKLVHPGQAGRVTLAREGRLLARCEHPNVLQLFDAIEVGDDVALVMEIVRGGTLEDWLASGPSCESIVARFCDAGRGLAAAHRAGVVHGDFKPRNVLLDGDRVVVADFGLGHVEEAGVTHDDALGSLVEPTWGGTPGYLAPERRSGPATPKSDQYAFAAALRGALPQLPRHLRGPLARMMDPDPGRRFADMTEAIGALGRARPRRVGLLLSAAAAVAALTAISGSSAARPGVPPPSDPRSYDEDDPRRQALAEAEEALRARDFDAVISAVERRFDLSEPDGTLEWARAANFASKAHGASNRPEAKERLANAAAEVAIQVGASGLAAEATLTVLQARMERDFTPDVEDLLRRAQAYSERALREPGDETADRRTALEIELARAAVLAGRARFEDAMATLDDAIVRATELPSAGVLGRLRGFRGKLRLHLGDVEGAREDAVATLEIREQIAGPDSAELIEPLKILMHVESAAGNHESALEHATRAVELVDDGVALARVLKTRGGMLAIVKRFDEAEADLVRAEAIFEPLEGTELDRCDIALNLARIRGWQGRVDEALALLERSQVLAESVGRPDTVARGLVERCRVLVENGRRAEGLRACDEADAAYAALFGAEHPLRGEIREIRGK